MSRKTKCLTLKFTVNEIKWLLTTLAFANLQYPAPALEEIIAKLRAKIESKTPRPKN